MPTLNSAAAQSMDGLMDLVASLQISVTSANPIIDATSLSGLLIRSVCCLGFASLTFTEMCRLWDEFQNQINQIQPETLQQLPSLKTEEPLNIEPQVESWSLSPSQMEYLLRQECQRLGLPGQTSQLVQEGLNLLNIIHSELPSAHFARYLVCLQSKERVGAMDALHAYFDHVLIFRSNSSDHLQILQFAAILLAALHMETGDISMAKLATEEAVRVAQQQAPSSESRMSVSNAMGKSCIAYSLGWLSRTLLNDDSDRANSNQARDEWMGHCVHRAVEQRELQSLVAGASLSRVRYALFTRSVPSFSSRAERSMVSPQVAWNFLFAAAATTEGGDAAASTSHHFIPMGDRPVHMTSQLAGPQALKIMSQQRLLASAVWDAYNHSMASGLASYLALHGVGERELVQSAIQNLARTTLYGSTQALILTSPPDSKEREMKSSLLESKQKAIVDENAVMREHERKCIYKIALEQITLLRKAFELPLDLQSSQEVALIFHEWACRRGDLNDARGWMRFLLSNLSPGMANFSQILLDVRLQQSLQLQAEGKWEEAKTLLKGELATSRSSDLPLQTAWILLQLGIVVMESSSASLHVGSQNHSFTNTLPYILECMAVCDEHLQDGLHSMAMVILAQLHLRMHRIDHAIGIIEAAMPTLLQKGHVWFQADAHLTLAKCQLQKKNKSKAISLHMASRALEQAHHMFERCHDGRRLCQVYCLQAKVWNASMGTVDGVQNFVSKRDKAAEMFVKCQNYLGKASSPVDDSFQPSLFDEEEQLDKLMNKAFPCLIQSN